MTDKIFESIIYDAIEKEKPSISVLNKASVEMAEIAASNAVAPKIKKKFSVTKLATCITCCLIVLVVGLCIPLFLKDSNQNNGGGVAGNSIENKSVMRIGESEFAQAMLHFNYTGNYLCMTNLYYNKDINFYIMEELSNYTIGSLEKKTLYVEMIDDAFGNKVDYDLLKQKTSLKGVEIVYDCAQIKPKAHEFSIGYYNYEARFKFKQENYTYYGHLLSENSINIESELNELING